MSVRAPDVAHGERRRRWGLSRVAEFERHLMAWALSVVSRTKRRSVRGYPRLIDCSGRRRPDAEPWNVRPSRGSHGEGEAALTVVERHRPSLHTAPLGDEGVKRRLSHDEGRQFQEGG